MPGVLATSGNTPSPTVTVDVTDLFNQAVTWKPCDDVARGAECATIKAPLDWDQPDGDTIDIAMARLVAAKPDQRVGSLLLNPGGPGGSGIGFLDYFSSLAGQGVLDSFDVIGFDPRGVGDSSAVVCFTTTQELDDFYAVDWPVTPEGFAESAEIVRPFVEACDQNTGPLLGHVDTDSSAKDMDLIRAVLGDQELYYVGYSYGSQLGAAYAELFPDNVGRLVLDGAVDPSLPSSEHDLAQATGFQQALGAYVDDCLGKSGCPLTGSKDAALNQIHELLVSIAAKPLPGDGQRELTLPLALNGLLVTMYEDSAWFMLTTALGQALKGDGIGLLMLSDIYLDRDDTEGYTTNQMEAFVAIGCLDSRAPADLASAQAQADRLIKAAPTFGEFWGFSEKLCDQWPYPQVGEPKAVTAAGAAPILVIGTTGDPATPFAWAQALADQLESGVLLTYEGHGHTAYGRSNSCVNEVVDAYLVDGAVPGDGKVC